MYLLVIIPYPLVGGLGDFFWSIIWMSIFLSFGLTPGVLCDVYVLFNGSLALGCVTIVLYWPVAPRPFCPAVVALNVLFFLLLRNPLPWVLLYSCWFYLILLLLLLLLAYPFENWVLIKAVLLEIWVLLMLMLLLICVKLLLFWANAVYWLFGDGFAYLLPYKLFGGWIVLFSWVLVGLSNFFISYLYCLLLFNSGRFSRVRLFSLLSVF